MNKILVIIRREYVQGVRGKAFIVSTVLAPVFMFIFLVVPALIVGLKTGEPTRVSVVDETGRLYQPLREAVLSGPEREAREREAPPGVPDAGGMRDAERGIQTNFVLEEVPARGRALEEVKAELSRRVLDGKLDVYLVLPADILQRGEAELYARNTGDMITLSTLEDRLNRAVIEQRMRDENISQQRVSQLSKNVSVSKEKVTAEGTKRDDGGSFLFAIGVGTFVLIAMLMYGQAILSAVVEEKTTRIVEVLFSSVDAFKLLAGKLVGVSLVALTQFTIWALMFLVLALYSAGAMAMGGMNVTLPTVPPQAYLYALLFFMLGFFVYATIYAVIGAIVTTEKEASQIVVPVSLFPVIAIYLAFPVIRSPGSSFSFWVSMIPFFSPVTMLVRVVTETPPLWQIALSLLIGVAVVLLMIWIAARIYRTGMLMYGKRATIPEILRWIRQT
ncbi:MAG TPA: ABC transporter permease [Pyrinomonadaceae bacterium]|nr:ABC transporter permease [Pyrinomonadaceae bacterium]